MPGAARGFDSIPSSSRQWVKLLFRLFWVSVQTPVPEICVSLHGQAWMVNHFWVYRPPLSSSISQCSSVVRSMRQQCGNTCPDQVQQQQSVQPTTSHGSGSVCEPWSPSICPAADLQCVTRQCCMGLQAQPWIPLPSQPGPPLIPVNVLCFREGTVELFLDYKSYFS